MTLEMVLLNTNAVVDNVVGDRFSPSRQANFEASQVFRELANGYDAAWFDCWFRRRHNHVVPVCVRSRLGRG